MGLTLAHHPHAKVVLEAHARHAGSLSPTTERYYTIALLAQYLTTKPPEASGCSAAQREAIRARASCLEVLDRAEWTRAARAGLAADDNGMRWLGDHRAPQLRSRAFPDREPDVGKQGTPGVRDLGQ